MEKKILIKVLQLDSLINFLNWKERVRIHLYMMDKLKTTTPRILAAYEWIEKIDWSAPEMKYGHDCLQYFLDPDCETWLDADFYEKRFTEYNQIFKILKNINHD